MCLVMLWVEQVMPYLVRALQASQGLEDFVYGSAASMPLTQVVRRQESALCICACYHNTCCVYGMITA